MAFLLTAVLIAAASLVFWLLWRRARLNADDKRSEQSAASSVPSADKLNTLIHEVARPQDRPPLESSKAAKGKPEEEQAVALQAGGPAQPQSKPDTSSKENTESHDFDEADGMRVITGEQKGPGEQFSQEHSDDIPFLPLSETEAEYEALAADIGASGTSGPESLESEIIPATAVPIAPSDDMQTAHKVPEMETARTAAPSPEDGLTQTNTRAEQEQPSQRAEESVGGDGEKAPHRYRPPPQRPPRQGTARPVNQTPERADRPHEVELEIRVRLKFDRFSLCEIGFLPEHTPEVENELDVRLGGISLHLLAQEDWYEDLRFENIGERLLQGIELKGLLADHRCVRWLLTGRDIYVLASHERASGFVSTARLVLGRSHVVLCLATLLPQVEAILNEAGCQGYTKLEEAHGVPSGWVGLRGVAPTKALPLNSGSDPFYAIKPAPDIEVEFEDGVCLRNSVWLAGFPPRIKLFGQANGPVKVLIDGKEASHTAEGSFVVDGYDHSGQHAVYCEGLSCSRSYSIEEPPDSWLEWAAYNFGQADICGPLVQLTPEAAKRRIFSVPMSNPLLLGAEPGQIFRCSPRSVANWKGFVPFDVVWALPGQPLSCDKKTARILQFTDAPLALSNKHRNRALGWSTAILDASRKGLRIENSSPDAAVLWREYKKVARNIWRGAR